MAARLGFGSSIRAARTARLTGSLPDQAALSGVIHQLEAFALELVEIDFRAARGEAGDGDPFAVGQALCSRL